MKRTHLPTASCRYSSSSQLTAFKSKSVSSTVALCAAAAAAAATRLRRYGSSTCRKERQQHTNNRKERGTKYNETRGVNHLYVYDVTERFSISVYIMQCVSMCVSASVRTSMASEYRPTRCSRRARLCSTSCVSGHSYIPTHKTDGLVSKTRTHEAEPDWLGSRDEEIRTTGTATDNTDTQEEVR